MKSLTNYWISCAQSILQLNHINQMRSTTQHLVQTHGSETWPMKVEHEKKLERTEMKMIRIMCGVSLMEKNTSKEPVGQLAFGTYWNSDQEEWFEMVWACGEEGHERWCKEVCKLTDWRKEPKGQTEKDVE